MFNRIIITVFAVLLFTGCATGINGELLLSQFGGLPWGSVDYPFKSVDYYKKNYGVDLLSKNHNMQSEIKSSHDATRFANHFYSGIKQGGKSIINIPI